MSEAPSTFGKAGAGRRVLVRLFQVAVIALTCGFVVRTLYRNWHEVSKLEPRITVGSALGALLLALGYLLGRGLLWHRIVTRSIAELPWPTNVACWLASALGKYVPGKVFLFLGRVYVYQRRGASVGLVALGFVLEMAALFIATALLFMLGTLTAHTPGPAWLPWLAIGGAAAATAGVHPAMLGLALRIAARFGRVMTPPRPPRLRDTLGDVLHMLGCWLVLGTGLWLIARTLVPLPITAMLELTGGFALAGVAGIAVLVAPSGVGVREGMMTLLLSPLLGPGVAAAFAIVTRLWMTVAEVGAALAGMWLLRQKGEAGFEPPGRSSRLGGG